jgi:hypothetical protein
VFCHTSDVTTIDCRDDSALRPLTVSRGEHRFSMEPPLTGTGTGTRSHATAGNESPASSRNWYDPWAIDEFHIQYRGALCFRGWYLCRNQNSGETAIRHWHRLTVIETGSGSGRKLPCKNVIARRAHGGLWEPIHADQGVSSTDAITSHQMNDFGVSHQRSSAHAIGGHCSLYKRPPLVPGNLKKQHSMCTSVIRNLHTL